MSTVKATYSGFVSHGGIPVLLSAGEDYDAGHPLVAARPDLFTAPPKTSEPAAAGPAAEQRPDEPKRGPGRPPGSKNRPKTDG